MAGDLALAERLDTSNLVARSFVRQDKLIDLELQRTLAAALLVEEDLREDERPDREAVREDASRLPRGKPRDASDDNQQLRE